ncbi:MAG TPA: hypothetical protein VLK84_18830 [Longimicrobium sp.]|nr:hypothetical protein [Longimicrobium sp.]
MIAIVTSDRGPVEKAASGKVHQALGRPVAAGEGTAIRVFSKRQDRCDRGGCVAWYIIHTIAISKTVPAPENRMTRGMAHGGPHLGGRMTAEAG